MSRVRRSLPFLLLSACLATVLALAPSGSVAVPTTVAERPAAQAATTSAAVTAPVAARVAQGPQRKGKKRKPFRVKGGVTFNSPLGGPKRARILINKVNTAIRKTRRGQEIRIFSWKIWTASGVTALLRAQRRGVKVQALMDKSNTIVEDNPHFWRLRRGLREGNKGRPKARRSDARLCQRSCRGGGGAAHSKFMLFSKAGASRWVYIHSSANWGDAAANRQWNDMYTFVGDKGVYNTGVKVFDQAWRDKKVRRPWVEHKTSRGSVVVAWSPTTKASRRKDRLVNTLKRVRCFGATNGAGNRNRRTIIRTAPDVLRGSRGMAVARQLRRLWDKGCDVKVAYTVLGIDEGRVLKQSGKRGPVPIRHLVQDFDGDGVFDRYFHLKAYTINGVIGKDRSAYWMVQGSANTANLSLYSDETYAYFYNKPGLTKRYQNHIDYWYNNFPQSRRVSPFVSRMVVAGAVDPYETMERDYGMELTEE